jgi:hypothetical protein
MSSSSLDRSLNSRYNEESSLSKALRDPVSIALAGTAAMGGVLGSINFFNKVRDDYYHPFTSFLRDRLNADITLEVPYDYYDEPSASRSENTTRKTNNLTEIDLTPTPSSSGDVPETNIFIRINNWMTERRQERMNQRYGSSNPAPNTSSTPSRPTSNTNTPAPKPSIPQPITPPPTNPSYSIPDPWLDTSTSNTPPTRPSIVPASVNSPSTPVNKTVLPSNSGVSINPPSISRAAPSVQVNNVIPNKRPLNLNSLPPSNKVMGSIGIAALSYIGLGVLLRGPDYLSYTSSGFTSFLGGLTTNNPYKDVILPGGHRVIPSLSNRTLMSNSRSDTFIDGYKVMDISIPSGADSKNKSIETNYLPEVLAATIGISFGVGVDVGMSKLSKSMANRSNTFRHVFDRDRTGTFSKNFSPLLLGAIAGAAISDNSIEDKVQGTYLGAMGGGFIGFLGMKEEIGPMLNKRLGLGLMGGALGLLIGSKISASKESNKVTSYSINKGGELRVTYDNLQELIKEDKATLPYDFYKHPEANKLVEAYLISNQRGFRGIEDTGNYADRHLIYQVNKDKHGYNTQIGKLNIKLDITVPSYSKEEGFIRVSQEEVRKKYSIKDTDSIDRANGLFNAYQIGLFIPSMTFFTIGTIAEVKNKPGVKKIVDFITNYTDKVKYLWPGERAIGEGIQEIGQGSTAFLTRGYSRGLNRGIRKLGEGIKYKVIGESLSLAKKTFIYAIPVSIISSMFGNIDRDNNQNIEVYSKEVSHYEAIETIMPKATGNKNIDSRVNLQTYMEEGTAYKLGDVIIYDSGTIGQGLRNFLETAPDKSVKALLYKLGHEQGLQEVISRKAAIGGIGISGGDNIDTFSFWDEIGKGFQGEGSWAQVFSYPLRASKHESLGAGIASITSPIVGGLYNNLATNLGFDPIYNYKFDKDVYSPLAHSLNTLTYGGLGAAIGIGIHSYVGGAGRIPMRGKGRFVGGLIGGLIGVALGATQPTYIDSGFYDSLSKQTQLSFGVFKESSAHKALTKKDSSIGDLVLGAGLTAGLPALVGVALPMKGRVNRGIFLGIVGYTTGMIISTMTGNGVLPSTLPMSRRFLTNEYDLSNQTFSVLPGARRGSGKQQLSHIHSKTLWSREEVFISTGNLDSVWKNIYGDESQFNIAVRVKGDTAKKLIPQLDILHEFMKKATPDSNLSSIVDQIPDLILGGQGSKSNEKILEFIQSAKGDLWISAPYLAGLSRDVRPLVEAIKALEAKGQNVHLIAQNPRGVSAGGQPEMSIALQRELLASGIDVYTTPYTNTTLTHAKLLADDVKTFITSHNLFSGNSMNKVVEVGIVLEGEEYAKATKQAALRFMIKNNFSNIKDSPQFSPEVSKGFRGVERVKALDINPQFAGLFDHHSGYLLLNSQMGASFFYSRALYNNLQRQAGFYHRIIDEEFGPATSLFKIAYLAHINKNTNTPLSTDLSYIPYFVSQYDKELQTQGVGGVFNEFVSMRLGMGRMYKDEYGFIGSIAGSIGAILDRTYLFFQGGNIVGVHSNYDDVDNKDMKYKNRMFQEGTFEALFTYLAVTAESAVASIALYISLGEPINLLIGEGFKTSTENFIRDAIKEEDFLSPSSRLKRASNLGLYDSQSSIQARLSLFSSITSGEEYFSVSNFKLTPYHVSNFFLRERSYHLQREVLEPFLLEKINPYERFERSQQGFRAVINKFIEEIRTPPEIRLVASESNLETISKLVKQQKEISEHLSSIGVNKKLVDVIISEAIGYKEVRSQLASALNLDPNASLDEIVNTLKGFNSSSYLDGVLPSIQTRNKLGTYTYTEEGKLISGVNLEIGNVGVERATRIARAVQDILDEIPLNPIHWKVFNSNSVASLLGVKEGGYQRVVNRTNFTVISKVATIGDILSFTDLTQTMSEIMFGKGGISAFIAANEIYSTEIDKSIARHSVDRIHTIWNMTAGAAYRASSRAWSRYKLVMGLPFQTGLMKASESLKAMEFNLFNKIGDDGLRGITWGDDAAIISKRIEDLTKEAKAIWEQSIQSGEYERISKYVSSLDQRGFIAEYIAEQLQPHVDPLARRINYIDESVVSALHQVDEVHQALSNNPRMAGTFLMEMQEHLRKETMDMFVTATMSGSNLQKRLIKLRPGDPYGLASKKKMASVAMSLLGIGTIFLEQLFTNTQGVSIFTQVATALTFSRYSDKESGVSTTFTNSAFLPGSGVSRYITNIGVNIGVLGLSHIIGSSILRAQALDYTFDNDLLYRHIDETRGASINIRLKHLDANGDEVIELVSDLIDDWKTEGVESGADLIKRLKGLVNEGYSLQYAVTKGASTKYLSAFVEGKYLKTRAIRFVGNTWFNTAVTYAVLTMAIKGVKGGIASTLNTLRDTTGTIDPILFGGIGMGIGAIKGGFRGGLAGLAVGVFSSFIMNSLGVKLLNIGGKGVKVDNLETGILSELSNFRHYVMANLGDASRAELMAALWSRNMESAYSILYKEPSGTTSNVLAKQITFPVFQFFFTSKVIGEQINNEGIITNPGQIYYSTGIQGPPISGISFSFGLPFKIVKGKGVFGTGIAYNEEANVMDYIHSVSYTSLYLGANSLALGTLYKVSNSLKSKSAIKEVGVLEMLAKMSKGTAQLVDDVLMTPVEFGYRVVTSLATVDIRNAFSVAYKEQDKAAQLGTLRKPVGGIGALALKTLLGLYIGGQIGSLYQGIVSKDTIEYQDKVSSAIDVGALIGGGLAVGHHFIYPKIYPHIQGKLFKYNSLPRLPRYIPALAIGIGVGTLMANSSYGLSSGMDFHEDELSFTKYAITAVGYGTVLGTVAYKVGNIGLTMADTLQKYVDLDSRLEMATVKSTTGSGLNRMVNKAKKFYYSLFIDNAQKEAQMVVDTIKHNQQEIDVRYNQVKGVKGETVADTLPDGYARKAVELIDNNTDVKFLIHSSENKEILNNINKAKGSFLESRFHKRIFPHRVKRTVGGMIALGIGLSILMGGNEGQFYDYIEGASPDQSKVRASMGKMQAVFRSSLADIFRLITGRDKKLMSPNQLNNVFRSASEYTGIDYKVQYEKLLKTRPDLINSINSSINGFSQLMVFDSPNAFISIGVIGGAFRRSEYGNILTPYIQIQGTGADISTASYQMVSRFYFNSVIGGANNLYFDIMNAVKISNQALKAGQPMSKFISRQIAINLLSVTAKQQPLQKRRKVSMLNEETISALSSDSLLGAILKHRVNITKNLSYQPPLSLATRLLLNNVETNPQIANPVLLYLLSPDTLKELGLNIDSTVFELLSKDPFFLLSKSFVINGINSFALNRDAVGNYLKGIFFPAQIPMDHQDIWKGGDSSYISSYYQHEGDIGFAIMQASRTNPILQLLGNLTRGVPSSIKALGAGVIFASLLGVITFNLGRKGLAIEDRALYKEINEYFLSGWFKQSREAEGFAWTFRTSYPLVGKKASLKVSGENYSIIYKGAYQFVINNRIGNSVGISRLLAKVQEDLYGIITESFGAEYDDKGVMTKKGTNLADWFLSSNKQKELIQAIESIDKPTKADSLTITHLDENGNSTDKVFTVETDKPILDNLNNLKHFEDSLGELDEAQSALLIEFRSKQTSLYEKSLRPSTLVKNITDVFMKDMEDLVDRYIDTLIDNRIRVNENYLLNLPQLDNETKSISEIFDSYQDPNSRYKGIVKYVDSFGDVTRWTEVSFITILNPNMGLQDMMEISYLLKNKDTRPEGLTRLVAGMSAEQKALYTVNIDGKATVDIHKALKEQARVAISDAVEQYISQFPGSTEEAKKALLKHFQGTNPRLDNMTIEVLGGLIGLKKDKDASFFSLLRHHWAGLGTTPTADVTRGLSTTMRRMVNFIRGKSSIPDADETGVVSTTKTDPYLIGKSNNSPIPMGIMTESGDEVINRVLVAQDMARADVGFGNKIGKGFGILLEFLGFGVDVVEGVSTMAAFSRLGHAYTSETYTEAQIMNEAMYAGTTLVNSALSILILGAASYAANVFAAGTLAAFIAPLVIIGVASLAGFAFNKWAPDSIKSKVHGGFNKLYEGAAKMLKGGGDFFRDKFGKRAASAFSHAVGGIMMGGMIVASLGTISSISALVGLGTAISMPALGSFLLAGAAIGGVTAAAIGFLNPGLLDKTLGPMVESLSNVRIGNVPLGRLFVIRPDQWLYEFMKTGDPITGVDKYGAPIKAITANDLIKQDYAAQLLAADDYTGSSAASLFIHQGMYGTYNTNNSIDKYGKVSIIRPPSILSPFIQKEIKYRGQLFNQSIVGRYVWNTLLANSSNQRHVRKVMESPILKPSTNALKQISIDAARHAQVKQFQSKSVTLLSKSFTIRNIPILASIIDKFNDAKAKLQAKIAYAKLPIRAIFRLDNITSSDREYKKDLRLAPMEVAAIVDGNIIRKVTTSESEIKEEVFNNINYS